ITSTRPTVLARFNRSRRTLLFSSPAKSCGSIGSGLSAFPNRPVSSSSSFDIVLLLLVDLQGDRERVSGLGQRVLDGPLAHPERVGDLARVHLQEVAKDRDLPLTPRQSGERSLDVHAIDAAGVIGDNRCQPGTGPSFCGD